MSATFVLVKAAARDLDEILNYVLVNSGPSRAIRVHAALLRAMLRIAARPLLVGHIRDDLADESLRAMVVFSYLIIYRPRAGPVQILRVIHGARDLMNAMTEET